jgi:hypothetical protein
MEMIKKHPDKPWDWEGISSNPNLTMEMIVNIQINPGTGMKYLVIPILLWKWLKLILINLGTGRQYLLIPILLWKWLKNILINPGTGKTYHLTDLDSKIYNLNIT